MPVEGTDLPIWGLEVDPDEAKNEFIGSNAAKATGMRAHSAPHSRAVPYSHAAV